MKKENARCLVLNGDYSPLGIIDWKKAVTWLYRSTQHLEILDFYQDDYILCSNSKKIPIPSVVRTIKYYKLKQNVNFSRKNLFIRDNYTCQYCQLKLNINELTYDHVIPRAQWNTKTSPTCWTNIVTSCKRCNLKKGNRTPVQANMILNKIPLEPKRSSKYLPVHQQVSTIDDRLPESWRLYLG